MSSVDKLLKRYGFNPKKWEPHPKGPVAVKLLNCLRQNYNLPITATPHYDVIETGTVLQEGNYTVFSRITSDGLQSLAVYEGILNLTLYDPKKREQIINQLAQKIPETKWIQCFDTS